jgi:hypothetical protein
MNSIENNTEELTTCILCGDDLVQLDEPVSAHCDFCGQYSTSSNRCDSGHFICDNCFNISLIDYIKRICLKYQDTDPIGLAVDLMNSPVVMLHGSEHHFIVPAVLLTCVANALDIKDSLSEKLELAEKRCYSEIPTLCNFNKGLCGAAMGTGIFLSIFNNQTNATDDEWSLSNSIVSASLKKISENISHRCCKRDTYISLQAAVEFLKEKYAIDLTMSEARCTFSLRNHTCRREECNYYNMSFSLV